LNIKLSFAISVGYHHQMKNIKLGRNETCHCGSGKKYKNCCQQKDGAFDSTARISAIAPSVEQFNQLNALFNAGQFELFEIQSLSLIKSFPNSGICWKALGVAQQAQGKSGLEALQKAALLLPEDAETHRNIGFILQKLGRLSEAEASHRQTVVLRPDLAEAHKNLGIVLKDLGRLPEAEKCFRNALKIQPDYFDALTWLGNTLFDQGLFAEAEDSHRGAINTNPNSAEAHRNLAISLKQQGRFSEAETSYLHAIKIKPNFAYVYYELGDMLKEQKRLNEAEEYLKSYLELEPDDPRGARLFLSSIGVMPVPLKASEKQLDELYLQRAKTWDNNDKNPYQGAVLVAQTLKRLLPQPMINSILDAGCGTGSVGLLIRNITYQLDGVDMSSAMLDKAKEKEIYNNLAQDDLESFMKNTPKKYDAITCAATLIHFGDLKPAFNAAAKCLNDNGLFVFTLFPNNQEAEGKEVIVAEIDDLARGGCFAHGRNYVRRVAGETGFVVEVLEEEVHEYSKEVPVMGLIVAMRCQTMPN
jgi:predicted TPR repeat methyltransferase